METVRYASIMLLAGIGIPLLAALNAKLGMRIGAPAAAAVVLFSVALLMSIAAMLVTRTASNLSLVFAQPKYLLLGGVFVAFYVLSVTWIAPHFGVGNAVFCVLLGQLISSALIDHFGLFGAIVKPVEGMRILGLALMVAGVALTQFSSR